MNLCRRGVNTQCERIKGGRNYVIESVQRGSNAVRKEHVDFFPRKVRS
jgi:hypothetical protein